MAFWADTAPFKGLRLASCFASGTTEKQELQQVYCASCRDQGQCEEQLTQTLIMHLFNDALVFVVPKIGRGGETLPHPLRPPVYSNKTTLFITMLLFSLCCRLALLWFHTIVRPFFGLDGSNLRSGSDAAQRLIDGSKADFADSALFLFFQGRVDRLKVSLSLNG